MQELKYEDFLKGDPQIFTNKKMELIQQRFKTGKYWAYGIVKNNTLAYSCWVNAEKLQYPTVINKTTPFSQNEGLLQDAYCHSEHRGMGYHSKMNLYRLFKMKEKQLKRAVAIVLTENIPAYKTQLKSGFTASKKVTFYKILNKTFLFEKELS
ncbi:hypothetical protein [Maribellus luteus]|uniref:hypothetical protein n=1 Tax=Maribellus luteus TaxID=2305463 RepID=UPI001390450B|nr:hypothetical protein [Maribellus luteus]